MYQRVYPDNKHFIQFNDFYQRIAFRHLIKKSPHYLGMVVGVTLCTDNNNAARLFEDGAQILSGQTAGTVRVGHDAGGALAEGGICGNGKDFNSLVCKRFSISNESVSFQTTVSNPESS